jgi:hypothetical protein
MKRLTTEEFIEIAKEVHGNIYDYNKVEYKNTDTKVCIICKEHGEFWQTPYKHTKREQGCPKCGAAKSKTYTVQRNKLKLHKKPKMSQEEFLQKCKEVHGNRYDYSKAEYKGSKEKVCIICKEHGEFWQIPKNHYINKCGCPICNESKGEKEIAEILTKANITFERQKTFTDCRNKKELPFDFYLPNYNLLIEYDGEQHFTARGFISEKKLKKTQKCDVLKNLYCNKNNSPELLRISYTDNIKESLVFLL